jgi:hypothetical protein
MRRQNTEHYQTINQPMSSRYQPLGILFALCMVWLAWFPSYCYAQITMPKIEVWYGDEQSFGRLGTPQRWVNVLGRVVSSSGIQSLEYILNDGPPVPLSIGPDQLRLAGPGDFNIEIDHRELTAGVNTVAIMVMDSSNQESSRDVILHYTKNRKWPLPYHINWKDVRNIQDVAQVVDGRWQLAAGGVRILEPYYDRVIALGDVTWQNYEVTVPVTFHGFRQPQKGFDGGANVIHAAIAVRWPGHDEDGRQPRVKWYPLGATAEFRLTSDLQNCSWRILGGGGKRVNAESGRRIIFGECYQMKHRVETLPNGNTRYRVKLWNAAQAEPEEWDLQEEENRDDVQTGGALLIAHYTDVTFGNVTVMPVKP